MLLHVMQLLQLSFVPFFIFAVCNTGRGELALRAQCLFLKDSGVDEERMKPGYWLGSVFEFPSVLSRCCFGDQNGIQCAT